jgi:hypothetical protein
MNAHIATIDLASVDLQEQESRAARRRFGAIVRTLRRLRPPAPAARETLDLDQAQPTRRLNRMRKLLGKLPRPGKSRGHARRLR